MKSVSQEKQTSCRERGWRLRWRWSGNKQLELNRKSRTIVEQPWFLHRWRAPSRKGPEVYLFIFFHINDAKLLPASVHSRSTTQNEYFEGFGSFSPTSTSVTYIPLSQWADILRVFPQRGLQIHTIPVTFSGTDRAWGCCHLPLFLKSCPHLCLHPSLDPLFSSGPPSVYLRVFLCVCVGGVGLSAGGLGTLDESLWPHNLSILKFKHSNTLSKHWRVMSF